jgi:manganese efflux pump family protein
MHILMTILLGVSLSIDTFAVSVSCGLIDERIKFFQAVRIAVFFTLFQALMPILGWLIGSSIKSYIIEIDHWVAFSLLSIIGVKMIYESLKNDSGVKINPHSLKIILSLSLATTIDAFVVGISFAFIHINLVMICIIIGIVTFMASMSGMLFGKKIGRRFGKRIEIVGGIVLILLGLKIVIEHMM